MRKIVFLIFFISGCATLDNANFLPVWSESNSFQDLGTRGDVFGTEKTAKIGFIEFDDLGFQRDSKAVSNVFKNLSALESSSTSSPILMVVFVHGWHHDARPDDSNVMAFKAFLQDLQYEEEAQSFSRNKRQVVGVYIGWRGESNESLLNPLTYRSRKSSGLRVGQYGLQEVLADLNKVVKTGKHKNTNRLVSIGHSFGGGVLYSSVMQNLVDNVVNASVPQNNRLNLIDKAYGDLVILMNPALEAARLEVLNRRLSNVEFARCQPLVMASFTSEYDTALSEAFPLGQKLFFYDDKKVALKSDNANLVLTPYGNAPTFKTHELSCVDCKYGRKNVFLTKQQFTSATPLWAPFRNSKNAQFTVGEIKMTHYPGSKIAPGTPIMNVFVKGNNLIRDHNAIWGSDFSLFVRALIGMEFASERQCR